jgi:ribonuclease HII
VKRSPFEYENLVSHCLATQNPEADLFSTENKGHRPRIFIGLDEVGRGCLAGPVLACASLWLVEDFNKHASYPSWMAGIRDSKKLTSKTRESLFENICKIFPELKLDLPLMGSVLKLEKSISPKYSLQAFLASNPMGREGDKSRFAGETSNLTQFFQLEKIAVGLSSAPEIDSLNIWGATQLAMARALTSLHTAFGLEKFEPEDICLLVDGKTQIEVPPAFKKCPQVVAVGGDDLFLTVGVSSVVAKVLRDKLMVDLESEFPQFLFGKHKGYGTAAHIDLLRKHLPCPQHRRSFLGKISPQGV